MAVMTVIDEHWGKRIHELRKAKGLTQEELAERSGLSRSHIGKIEIGIVKGGSRETFARLARALGMTFDELDQSITGEPRTLSNENPDQIMDRLRQATPVAIPVSKEGLRFHAGEPREPYDYVYVPRAVAARKGIEAHVVDGDCLSPGIENGDYVVIDRDGQIDPGDIIAVLHQDKIHLGKLKKIADELFVENGHGRIKLTDCPIAAPVIQVVRKLK